MGAAPIRHFWGITEYPVRKTSEDASFYFTTFLKVAQYSLYFFAAVVTKKYKRFIVCLICNPTISRLPEALFQSSLKE